MNFFPGGGSESPGEVPGAREGSAASQDFVDGPSMVLWS